MAKQENRYRSKTKPKNPPSPVKWQCVALNFDELEEPAQEVDLPSKVHDPLLVDPFQEVVDFFLSGNWESVSKRYRTIKQKYRRDIKWPPPTKKREIFQCKYCRILFDLRDFATIDVLRCKTQNICVSCPCCFQELFNINQYGIADAPDFDNTGHRKTNIDVSQCYEGDMETINSYVGLKSGLRRRTPHDMRHTYATLRLSKGDSLAEVSKEMGHSTTDITYRTYYKWLPKESRTDIDELDQIPAPIRTLSAPKNEKGTNHVG